MSDKIADYNIKTAIFMIFFRSASPILSLMLYYDTLAMAGANILLYNKFLMKGIILIRSTIIALVYSTEF